MIHTWRYLDVILEEQNKETVLKKELGDGKTKGSVCKGSTYQKKEVSYSNLKNHLRLPNGGGTFHVCHA